MNLAFAIKALGNPGGGAERVLVDVVNGLVARGHTLSVISFDPPGRHSFYSLDPRIDWVRLGIGKTDQAATALETFSRISVLRRTVSMIKPQVAVGFMHSMYILLGLALVGRRIPMIASEHIVWAHYATRPIEKALLYLTPLLARRVTVVAQDVISDYPRAVRKHMVVVPNPVNLNTSLRADVTGSHRSQKVLLSVGRLAAQKNYATLIKAFSLIADRLTDWNLRIIGEGALRDELTAQIVELELKERVSLPGTIRDIYAEYAAAQLFVLPSLYEGSSLALSEALAIGLPAVGFADCPGIKQSILPGRNGALALGSDRVQALARTLEPLMTHAHLRARLVPPKATLSRQYSLEQALDRWEDLLQQCSQ
jgi:glycosyltransferase involved in cell wall biosynthesis